LRQIGVTKSIKLYDSYGRPLENLRISVTNECNYRCIFCHVEGHPSGAPSRPFNVKNRKDYMKVEEYGVVAEASKRLGIFSFKLTGGEPLIRPDILDIVSVLKEYNPSAEVSMTTNGYFLKELAQDLRERGLERINVSVHSLKRERYKFITGVDGLSKVLEGLDVAKDVGFSSIKINAVILKGVNEDEVWDLAELALRYDATLQLIELHPVGLGALLFRKYFKPLDYVEEELKKRAVRITYRKLHNRPIYELEGGLKVEVVRPYNNPVFCAGCNRVRLLPEGFLSPCLNWRGPYVNLIKGVRRVKTWEEKVQEAMKAIIKVNSMRRPYYLWPLMYPPLRSPGNKFNGLRIRLLPKKVDLEKVIRH
jgi:cyclic pyranopterin phosphate synthase